MKKTYLAPKSETLMAVLRELCGNNDPSQDPWHMEGASGGFGSGGGGAAPVPSPVPHSL